MRVRALCASLVLALAIPASVFQPARAQAPAPAGPGRGSISERDAREWITYLASDQLQGRKVFTEGYGLAASYIAGHLKEWGLEPLGDAGSYLQTVRRVGYGVTRNSSVTVQVGNESRTFRDGDHVEFPTQAGGRQRLVFNDVEFGGYGLVPGENSVSYSDFSGRDVTGRLVVHLSGTPKAVSEAGGTVRAAGGRRGGARSASIVQAVQPAAVIGFSVNAISPAAGQPAQAGGRGGRGAGAGIDIRTVDNLTRLTPPAISADETFFTFLFGGASMPFAELRARAERGDPLPAVTWTNVRVTVEVDNDYVVLATDLTQNVVGMIRGSDPVLRDTYVFVGAHLDHVGYAATNDSAPGRITTPLSEDRIWNGADDDASGSAGVLAIAKALAAGPRPKRSVVFVWHAGEESGLLGSRYMAEFPVVPLDRVQAQINIDMIGRNRDDKPEESNKLYVIGADRISTDLHNLMVETNRAMAAPLTLDFEYNDPADVNSFYTRSDHYSYASKGIPIAFFFTGTHPDYHANSDTVDKILFPKLVRVTEMIYEMVWRLANTDRALERDNLGPRSGRGFSGPIEKSR